MTAHQLSRRLTLEAPVQMPDGAGGHTLSWTELGHHWADIRASRGRETAVPGGRAGQLALKIVVRATPQGAPSRPRPEQRFREGARLFEIATVAEMPGRPDLLVCYATEETGS